MSSCFFPIDELVDWLIGWTGQYAEKPQLLREVKTDAGVCGLAVLKDVLYVAFFKESVIQMFDAGKPFTSLVSRSYLYLRLAASDISRLLDQERISLINGKVVT